MILRCFEIDVVDAGRGKPDETQILGGGDDLLSHTNLVDEHEIDAVDSFSHLFLRRAVKRLEVGHHPRKRRRIELAGAHGAEIEKNCFHCLSGILKCVRPKDD